MKIDFFNEQIKEELDGAKEYLTYANELKISNPSWSAKLYKMGCEEEKHANCLMKMLNEYSADVPHTDQYDAMYRQIFENVATLMPQITSMKDAYWKT